MKVPYEVTIFLNDGQTHELELTTNDQEVGELTDQVVLWASNNGLSYDDDILNWEYRELAD